MGTLVTVVMGQKGTLRLLRNFNRVLFMTINNTWQQMMDDDQGVFYTTNPLNLVVTVFVVVFGEIFMVKYIMAHCIYEATWMHRQILSEQNH